MGVGGGCEFTTSCRQWLVQHFGLVRASAGFTIFINVTPPPGYGPANIINVTPPPGYGPANIIR